MNTTTQKKGPAKGATFPDHGSTNPITGIDMNKHVNTTALAGSASDTAVATAMRNLEDDICSLLSMARILGDLLDNDLVSFEDGRKIQMPKRGQTMTVHLGYDQLDCLYFACNDVINRAFQLRERFYASHTGGGAAA